MISVEAGHEICFIATEFGFIPLEYVCAPSIAVQVYDLEANKTLNPSLKSNAAIIRNEGKAKLKIL